MRMWRTVSGATVFLLALGTGCHQPDQEAAEPEEMEAGLPDTPEESMVIDTTAEAVWAYLLEENYPEEWSFWPDRSPYYEGMEPHGALLNTYLNDLAVAGLTAVRDDPSRDDLPFGAVLVKENYAPDSTLAAITVMMKVEGYDPQHHDWFWMKRLPDGTVEASGRVEGCIDCHSDASRSWDYLMTAADQWGS